MKLSSTLTLALAVLVISSLPASLNATPILLGGEVLYREIGDSHLYGGRNDPPIIGPPRFNDLEHYLGLSEIKAKELCEGRRGFLLPSGIWRGGKKSPRTQMYGISPRKKGVERTFSSHSLPREPVDVPLKYPCQQYGYDLDGKYIGIEEAFRANTGVDSNNTVSEDEMVDKLMYWHRETAEGFNERLRKEGKEGKVKRTKRRPLSPEEVRRKMIERVNSSDSTSSKDTSSSRRRARYGPRMPSSSPDSQ